MSFKFNPFTGNLDIAGGEAGGSSGQIQWNSSGSFAGVSTTSVDGSGNLTFSGRWIQSTNGAASAPPMSLTGTWFTGGTSTTTKPQLLIEPAGTTSASWSTAGTGLGVNAPSGFTGNVLDLQQNGSQILSVNSTGQLTVRSSQPSIYLQNTFESNNYGVLVQQNYATSNSLTVDWAGNVARRLYSFNSAGTTNPGRVTINAISNNGGDGSISLQTINVERVLITGTGTIQIADASHVAVGTTTGTKFGTATTQKLAFYNATPVAQPAAVADATDAASVITQLNLALARLRTLGLIAT